MKYKIIITFSIVFTITFLGFSQELNERMKKQIEFAEKMTYDIGSNLFKEPKMRFETVSVSLPWLQKNKYTQEQLASALDSLENNMEIKIENSEYTGTTINFKSYFPAYIENVENIFKLSVADSDLSSSDKKGIHVKKDAEGIFFGNKSLFRSVDGENTEHNWKTINCSFMFEDRNIKTANGSIVLLTELASTYEFIKITPSDIDKEFSINGKKYKIINIAHNKVIVAPIDVKAIIDKSLKFLNIDNEGKKIDQIATGVNANTEDDDKKIRYSEVSTSTIPGKVYEIFREDPEITMEGYKDKIHHRFVEFMKSPSDKDIQLQQLGQHYIVFESAGPINNFYLYTPLFDIKKKISAKL